MAQLRSKLGKRKLEEDVTRCRTGKIQKTDEDISSSSEKNISWKKQICVNKPQWAFLSPEILVKIFGYVVENEESAIPCLLKISKVCSSWRRAAHVPCLWNCLRFTSASIKNEKVFKSKVASFQSLASKCFKQVKSLICLDIISSSSLIINAVAEHAEKLVDVSLNYSGKITYNNCLKSLIEQHGGHLESFVLNGVEVSSYDLNRCVSGLGENLQGLMIVLEELPRRLNFSYSNMCNLEVLVLKCQTELKLSYLCGLKKLRILGLINVTLNTKHATNIEWPCLEEIQISPQNSPYSYLNVESEIEAIQLVIKALSSSSNLRKIDLGGNTVIIEDLLSLRADCPLQYLDISGCFVDELPSLLSYFTSLAELRLNNCHPSLNKQLVLCNDSLFWNSLEHLSLVATDISLQTLTVCLPLMKKLKTINLTSCRELPRGFKRKWNATDLRQRIINQHTTSL